MKYLRWVIGCAAIVLSMIACGPRPTATPGLATGIATRAGPTFPRSPNATPRVGTPVVPRATLPPQSPSPSPLPTARAHLFDDVEPQEILAAVFPNLALSLQPEGFQVQNNKDWLVWVNDRDEGRITQTQQEELVAIIASEVGASPPKEAGAFGPSSDFVALLQRQNGKLVMTHREKILPPISPLAIDVRIGRIVDVDHDGQDELLVATNTVQTLIIRTEAHLYRWEGNTLKELWKGVELNDNTAAVNQDEFSVYEATLDFADLDNNGVDEIIANARSTVYPKDPDGRADLTAPANVSIERIVYKWNGDVFALDRTLSTPAVPLRTPTP